LAKNEIQKEAKFSSVEGECAYEYAVKHLITIDNGTICMNIHALKPIIGNYAYYFIRGGHDKTDVLCNLTLLSAHFVSELMAQ